jgi:chaperonin GroES
MNEEIEIIDSEELEESPQLEGAELLKSFFDLIIENNKQIFKPKPNIANLISDDMLLKIGYCVIDGFEVDLASMQEWLEDIETGKKLVKQEKNGRSEPWEGASNFKSPTLTNAALKFGDRASTELLRQHDIVKTAVIGKDEGGLKAEKSNRVAIYQNYQINIEMEEWREEQERLIYDLPYSGCSFKKTFYDSSLGRNDSILITSDKFAVNQGVQSINRLRRFSEIIDIPKDDMISKQRQGLWLETKEEDEENYNELSDNYSSVENQTEEDKYQQFIEQQGFYDLDGDGYQEPYTFVVHRESKKVVRIIPRFELENVLVKNKNSSKSIKLSESDSKDSTIIRIKANQNITKYGFIRDPQGGFLDVGFYNLLGALTASINATTNQLVDAGTLSNVGGFSGWLAKGFRAKMGNMGFKLGRFTQTNLSVEELQKGIRQLPVGQPSLTLFSLMQMMVANSQELSASTDLSTSLGANAPATTTLALVQEQQQFAGAIISRLYRSMSSEFKKLFELNAKFIDPLHYQQIVDDESADYEADFDLSLMDIIPVANPEISSKVQRLQLAEVEMSRLTDIAAAGGDPKPVIINFLNMIGSTNVSEIFPDLKPEQQLQELIAKNPQLAEIIAGEQQRAQMLQQAEQQAMQMQQAIATVQLEKATSEIQRKDAEAAVKLTKTAAETAKIKAETIKVLEEAESENLNNEITTYTAAADLTTQANEAANEQSRLSRVASQSNNSNGFGQY